MNILNNIIPRTSLNSGFQSQTICAWPLTSYPWSRSISIHSWYFPLFNKLYSNLKHFIPIQAISTHSNLHYALKKTMHHTLHAIQNSLHTPHYTLHIINYLLHNTHYELQNMRKMYTLETTDCTLHTTYYTLHTTH